MEPGQPGSYQSSGRYSCQDPKRSILCSGKLHRGGQQFLDKGVLVAGGDYGRKSSRYSLEPGHFSILYAQITVSLESALFTGLHLPTVLCPASITALTTTPGNQPESYIPGHLLH